MASFFIDANVIANWLLVHLDLNKNKNHVAYFKEIKQNYPKAYYSYLLLDSIYHNKDNGHEFNFYTSRFAVSEVVSVIHEKYLLDYMYQKGISFKYWFKYKDKIALNKENLSLISTNIIRFHIKFIPHCLKLADDTILQHTIDLIINKKCETPDAFLVSQCLHKECVYFATEDGPLKDKLKSIKNLKGLNSQMSIDILKKSPDFIVGKLS